MTDPTPLDYSQYTLLIVDDNPTNLGVLFDYLETFGFRILVAQDGESGLKRAHYAHPDLILLDVMMPGMDGFEMCRQLRTAEDTRDIPVIFMTALVNTEDKVRGLQAGAVDYVTKPIQQEEVLARITTHLRLRALTVGLQAANAEITRFNQELEAKVRQRTAELQRAYDQLERLHRKKTEFIAVISHELRTPMTILSAYSQMLVRAESVQADPTLTDIGKKVTHSFARLQEIVNALLEVAQIDNQELALNVQKVNLAELFQRVGEDYAQALQTRGLTLTRAGLETLPAIEADPQALAKVFDNLLSNAIKYTPDGGCITISGQQTAHETIPGEWVELVVADTGIGIEPGSLELIFTKFYYTNDIRLHSSGKTKFKGGGPGLGLTLARGLIEAHGGRIWAESLGHDEATCPGSRFYILLPLAAPPRLER